MGGRITQQRALFVAPCQEISAHVLGLLDPADLNTAGERVARTFNQEMRIGVKDATLYFLLDFFFWGVNLYLFVDYLALH